MTVNQKFQRSDCGFTLAEMLVAMTLISLSASIAYITYQKNSSDAHLDRTSKQIIRFLRSARIHAVLTQTDQLISINLKERRFTSTVKADVVLVPEELQMRITAADGQTSKNSTSADNEVGIRFFAVGGSTGATIVIGSQQTWNRVSVDWITAKVSFEAVSNEN
ncbi:MAG: type II secretion system protein [Hyphomicrobiales bacterium]|nr:type II secretion system protein [Hyphomicrobiales bacterium]